MNEDDTPITMPAEALDTLVHDARAPLNSITMNAELVKLLVEKKTDPRRVAELMDTIIRQCRLCNELMENFRNAHKSENE